MRARLVLAGVVIMALLVTVVPLESQQARVYRVGVVFHGGPYVAAVDGLRDGLRDLGFSEGKQIVLQLRNAKGDLKVIEDAARTFEREKVDLIVALATSVTQTAKRATQITPIVFYTGADPVAFGLVESFGRPGGRLTGVYGQFTDFTAKRLQLLKEMLPKLRRVVTIYNPDNPTAQRSVRLARDAARQLKVELIERTVSSVDELRARLDGVRPGEADAFFYVSDAAMTGQAEMIIEVMRAKRLPVMFSDTGSVKLGALAGYGANYYVFGRLASKYVHRILLGAHPGDLPVEQLATPQFVINLKTAKALGLTIPQSVLGRADEIIE